MGYVPNTDTFAPWLARNEQGEIWADEEMKTNVPSVFVAGESWNKRYRQVKKAIADGTIAAPSAMEYVHGDGRRS